MPIVDLLGGGCPICGKQIVVIDKRTYYAYEDGTPIPIGQVMCQECNKSTKVK